MILDNGLLFWATLYSSTQCSAVNAILIINYTDVW